MKIHKAGYRIILKSGILWLILNIFFVYLCEHSVSLIVFISIPTLVYLLIINFFRSPRRPVHIQNNTVLAPADGKIVVVEETPENEYFKDRRIQVSIFMNIFNVHINWYPINGIVKYFKYHKGKFSAAYLPKSSEENERTTIVIEGENGSVLMRQIAGAVAKRIVSYAVIGNKVSQDGHAGFIKFGSRVDLFLPPDAEIKVRIGDKTKGSQTPIAVLKNE